MTSNDWFTLDVPDSIRLDAPGIYEWRIDDEVEGSSIYIGQSVRLPQRLKEYPNNVRKIEKELPYRKGKPNGFRDVHKALANARRRKARVTVKVLETAV